MNTFIAKKSDGSKVDFQEGKASFGNLNSENEAKYCDCNEETTNTSEISDWATAENVAYVSDESQLTDDQKRANLKSATKRTIRKAMIALDTESELNTLLGDADFKLAWEEAMEIDFDDSQVIDAFTQITTTLDEVKNEILDIEV